MALYFVEVTDIYGGEANYSWVTRHAIRAKSERGAVCVTVVNFSSVKGQTS